MIHFTARIWGTERRREQGCFHFCDEDGIGDGVGVNRMKKTISFFN
jgi:hypothetical protein